MRNGLVGWVAAFAVSMAAAASAQDRLSLDGAVNVPPALQDEGKSANFTVGIRSELKRHEMDFDDSSVTGLAGNAEDADFFTQHNATFLTAEVAYKVLGRLVLSAHAGVGLESVVSTLDGDPTSVVGTEIMDDRFDDSFAWELGGGVGLVFEQVDVVARGTYRGGSTEADQNATTDLEYEYTSIEAELEAGYTALEYLRPFVGVSYTLYVGDWEIADPSAGQSIQYDLELEQPVGVFVGADLFVSVVKARFQVEFLDSDTASFLVFLGLVF